MDYFPPDLLGLTSGCTLRWGKLGTKENWTKLGDGKPGDSHGFPFVETLGNVPSVSSSTQFPVCEVDSAEATLSALSIMATTTTYTDQQLLDFSKEHLLYELNIFQWLVDAIPKTQKSFQLSAYLESFTVHLRALIDFLYEQPRWDGDVVAGDFFDSPGSWSSGAVPKILDDARTRMNKEVGHITIDRKTGMDPQSRGKSISCSTKYFRC